MKARGLWKFIMSGIAEISMRFSLKRFGSGKDELKTPAAIAARISDSFFLAPVILHAAYYPFDTLSSNN
jgi:hypothetical protein